MIEYDAHEPGTWRDAALHFRAENKRLTAQLAAVTAERDAATKRVATLENDLDHALASVGAFRQAIEDVWAKAAGESGEDGYVVSYVIPVGVLHRAIGLARGTDAGGTLLARLAASKAARDEWHDKAMVMAYAVRDQVTLAETRIIARQVIEHDAALAASSAEGE